MLMSDARHPLAQCRRDLYGLLSSAYLLIPEEETLEFDWKPAAELLEYPRRGGEATLNQMAEGLARMKSYDPKHGLDETLLTKLSRDWTRLVRGTESKGVVPPYESLYRSGRAPRKAAQEIHRLFSEMGIRVPEEWHQPPDFIGVELDFMRLLCAKELEAYEKQEKDSIVETAAAQYSFIENHLAAWVPRFCAKMREEAREDYYRGVALLTIGLIEYDRRTIELPRRPTDG